MPAANFGVGITGLGKAVPQKQISTSELAKRFKVSPESILGRTGIKTRHFAGPHESAASLSLVAAKQALSAAKIEAKDLGLIVGCTTSGDYIFPGVSSQLQALLSATNAGTFDLSASASSFPIALSLAADRLHSHAELQHVLVVGTAVQSPFINWKDEKMAALLGDASAAAVVSRVPKNYGVLASEVQTHGNLFEAAILRNGGFIEMDGVAMGREFLKHQPILIEKTLQKAGLKTKDVSLFVFHQANLRLIQMIMEKMEFPMSRTYTNVERLGNTAEASIPSALCEAHEAGRLKQDDIVVLSGVGAGCVLAVTVLRWTDLNSKKSASSKSQD